MQNISSSQRERLIKEHAQLIKFIAYRISARLPSHIEIDDLLSAGAMGLIDAVEKYDPSRNIKFKTYAEIRIRGAILDELRAQDWIPRSVRQRANSIENKYNELEQKLGRPATDEEMAEALGISIEDFYKTLDGANAVPLLSLDGFSYTNSNGEPRNILDYIEGSPDDNPHDSTRYNEIKSIIANTIDSLPKSEKLMISLYYYEELTMKEVGEVLNVTESRVSQIHTKAILRLRGRLKKFLEE